MLGKDHIWHKFRQFGTNLKVFGTNLKVFGTNLKVFGNIFEGVFSTWQNFTPILAETCYRVDFHFCKWPNIEQSSHLVTLGHTCPFP